MENRDLKILLVDDHKIVTESLAVLLKTILDCNIVSEVNNGEDAIEYASKHKIDIIFMDIMMPGRIDGIEATSRIMAINNDIKIIGLTMLSDAATIGKMIKARAIGFIIKNSSSKEILNAINVVMKNQFYIHPELRSKLKMVSANTPDTTIPLSKIEYEILTFLVQGYTTKEIAEKEFRSFETIKSHRKSIMHKLGCKNIADLVRYAISSGLVKV